MGGGQGRINSGTDLEGRASCRSGRLKVGEPGQRAGETEGAADLGHRRILSWTWVLWPPQEVGAKVAGSWGVGVPAAELGWRGQPLNSSSDGPGKGEKLGWGGG